MNVRYVSDKSQYRRMTTEELRESYLVTDLFAAGELRLHYIDVDRAVIGSAVPIKSALTLSTSKKELAAEYFAERREIGVINVGAPGTVNVDDQSFEMPNRSSLYIGRGSRDIQFASSNSADPAKFYLQSYPAHTTYPTKLVTREQANKVPLGSDSEANKRTIFQSICPGVVESCQIVMGFTELAEGSVWNTLPPHTHLRRSEVYMYFDLAENARMFHLMGQPDETRSLVIANNEAVISPSWSIHCGAGTSNYNFIWCMGGENQEFTDMDFVEMSELR